MSTSFIREIPFIGLGTCSEFERTSFSDPLKFSLAESKSDTETLTAITYALQNNVKYFETSKSYRSNKIIYKALSELNVERKSVFITSRHSSNPNLTDEIDRFGYLDIAILQSPPIVNDPLEFKDTIIPIWERYSGLVRDKCCRSVGICNFYSAHIEYLLEAIDEYNVDASETTTLVYPVSNTVEINIINQESKMADVCNAAGMSLVAYSPLGGINCKKVLSYCDDLSKSLGCTPAQFVLAWLQYRNIKAVPKSFTLNHIDENMSSSPFVKLIGSGMLEEIHKLERGVPLSETALECKHNSERLLKYSQ